MHWTSAPQPSSHHLCHHHHLRTRIENTRHLCACFLPLTTLLLLMLFRPLLPRLPIYSIQQQALPRQDTLHVQALTKLMQMLLQSCLAGLLPYTHHFLLLLLPVSCNSLQRLLPCCCPLSAQQVSIDLLPSAREKIGERIERFARVRAML